MSGLRRGHRAAWLRSNEKVDTKAALVLETKVLCSVIRMLTGSSLFVSLYCGSLGVGYFIYGKVMRRMRKFRGFLVVLLAVWMSQCYGQEKAISPDLTRIVEGKGWTLHNATAEAVEFEGKSGVRLKAKADSITGIAGLVVADAIEFTVGVIEIDLKGKSVRPSFLGVAFNVADERTFEAVYFRPFNFNAGGEFKSRAVQYIAWPEHPWNELRKNRPGKFEGTVNSVPDHDKWFHARIQIETKQLRVYVNEAKEPCLAVDRLAAGGKGRPLGLFVDTGDGLYASLKVIKNR